MKAHKLFRLIQSPCGPQFGDCGQYFLTDVVGSLSLDRSYVGRGSRLSSVLVNEIFIIEAS